jgi:hypothetical protein
LTDVERKQPFPAYIELALDDERWLKRGVPPFLGALDDWPADRAMWLDVVMTLRERSESTAAHDAQSEADYQQFLKQRKESR